MLYIIKYDKAKLLSTQEFNFAKRLYTAKIKFFSNCMYKELPDKLNDFENISKLKEELSIYLDIIYLVVKPNQSNHVFARAAKDLGMQQLGRIEMEIKEGLLFAVPYKYIRYICQI